MRKFINIVAENLMEKATPNFLRKTAKTNFGRREVEPFVSNDDAVLAAAREQDTLNSPDRRLGDVTRRAADEQHPKKSPFRSERRKSKFGRRGTDQVVEQDEDDVVEETKELDIDALIAEALNEAFEAKIEEAVAYNQEDRSFFDPSNNTHICDYKNVGGQIHLMLKDGERVFPDLDAAADFLRKQQG